MEIGGGTPLLARWTSDFDCSYETHWWYCIKDMPFDITALTSKKRYEINKGKKNFTVCEIDPVEYVEDIISVLQKAYAEYPKAYRPVVNSERMRKGIVNWRVHRVFGAFSVKENRLCAFACLDEYDAYVDFAVLKSEPDAEKLAVNAAIIATICEYYNEKLSTGFYICDGERNVVHQTAFQDYLIKYFGFRKAYCRLNIVYRKPLNLIVKCLYPFRHLLLKMDKVGMIHKVNAILNMEEIVRADK